MVAKVSCPECSTVLRPAKPLAPGKKVKCPRCDTIFTVRADDEDDEPARKPVAEKKSAKAASAKGSSRNPAKKAPAKEEAPKKNEEDEIGVYGWVKEDEDKEADKKEKKKKPKIEYAPDMSIKDLRGPAVAILMSPSNWLTLVGFLGFLGWLSLMVLIIIPAVFPIKEDSAGKVMPIGAGLGSVNPAGGMVGMSSGGGGGGSDKPKAEEERPSFFEIAGVDFSLLGELPWYVFWPCMLPMVVLMCCSGVVAYGAIQMQNLESRRWGIAGSIMAMVPISCGGFQLFTALIIQFGLGMIMDDTDFILIVVSILSGVEWLASISIGIWALKTLMNPDVIAGFEYVAE
jgi:hypothetical protein